MSDGFDRHYNSCVTSIKQPTRMTYSGFGLFSLLLVALIVSNQPTLSTTTTEKKNEKMRILYIITSSNEFYGKKKDRLADIVFPVIQDAMESLVPDYHVDLYLILSYEIDSSKLKELRNILPPTVGLQIWNDAKPFAYSCDETTGLCRGTNRKLIIPQNRSYILPGGAQLARQHRFVVKDKLLYYDFFMAFEDDMRVTRSHVEHHMKMMRHLQTLKQEAPESFSEAEHNIFKDQFWGPMTKGQIEHMRPGLIRVEVILPTNNRGTQRTLDPIPVDLEWNGTTLAIDPEPCCHSTRVGRRSSEIDPLLPKGTDLMMWESGILGTSVRQLPNGEWVFFLPGPSPKKLDIGSKSYWSGYAASTSQGSPNNHDAKLLAQSAGWMASRKELMELDRLCRGYFLPPYDGEYYTKDGLHRHNVEFWSGGIQQWGPGCNIQRVLSIEDLSRHLIYHTANNKQFGKPVDRQVLAQNYLGQVNAARKAAEREQHIMQRGN